MYYKFKHIIMNDNLKRILAIKKCMFKIYYSEIIPDIMRGI